LLATGFKSNSINLKLANNYLNFCRESIKIGTTDFTKEEIEQIVVLMGRDFRGIDYHLMNKNCNSFSSKFCKVKSIFKYIFLVSIFSQTIINLIF
jgi:hypothetical protein